MPPPKDGTAAPAAGGPNLPMGPLPETDIPPAAEDLLLALLRQQYPSFAWSPERLQGIRAGLRRNVQVGALLRQFPLTNGDGPATVFSTYVGPTS